MKTRQLLLQTGMVRFSQNTEQVLLAAASDRASGLYLSPGRDLWTGSRTGQDAIEAAGYQFIHPEMVLGVSNRLLAS